LKKNTFFLKIWSVPRTDRAKWHHARRGCRWCL
jgi:hypothetical protein